jgi:hypothetical protein
MTEGNGNPKFFARFDALRRYVPLAVWIIVSLTLLVIPLKIISMGFLPVDDALRHAAKAVSGKPWPDILVVGKSFLIDHNFGWHLLLRQIYLWFHCTPEGLVLLEVTALFLLLAFSALPWLKRPEAWLATLVLASAFEHWEIRYMSGRPFLLSISVLIAILFAWNKFGSSSPKWWMWLFSTISIFLATFVHGVWYLWALPVAAFFLAREFRWGFMLFGSWMIGTLTSAVLTGHPINYLIQALEMAHRAIGMHLTEWTMATEFFPTGGDSMLLVLLGVLVIVRKITQLNARPLMSNPAFLLTCLGWLFGLKIMRFSSDWGWPAMLVLMTCDLQQLLQSRVEINSLKRLAYSCFFAAAVYLSITANLESRWTGSLSKEYLDASNPKLKSWMPDKGGILYSVDMFVFYDTFFKNPDGDWRYMVGYEPTLMPDEDFAVYHKILWNFNTIKAYQPWVEKMKPADRLVSRGGHGADPNIPQLEWYYGVSGIWIGRLPRPAAPETSPPDIPARAPLTNSTP